MLSKGLHNFSGGIKKIKKRFENSRLAFFIFNPNQHGPSNYFEMWNSLKHEES